MKTTNSLIKNVLKFCLDCQKKGKVVIVGDFNIDLLKVEYKPKTKEYLDSIMIQGVFPKIIFLQDFLK